MKSAVLIVDVQTALFDVAPRPWEAQEVLQRIVHIIERARAARVPVIFMQHEQPGLLEPGSEGWQLHPAIPVADGEMILPKTTSDSFLRTGLEETLTSLGVDDLIICGYATEFCVDTTTRRATGLGYSVQLVSDAHTTRDKPHLSAKQIREHHNTTLSFSPTISAVKTADLVF